MLNNRTTGFLLAMGAVTALGVVAPANAASEIDSTDLATIDLGDQIAGPESDNFETSEGATVGQLTNNVYENDGVYTYTHEVTPQNINAVSEFNTGFDVQGFNDVAGYSFDEAGAAGGNGDDADFSIIFNDDNETRTLDFGTTAPTPAFLDDGETVTFFFQSDLPPGVGDYNITNSEVGTAQSFAPAAVPSPAALPAALLGLAGLAIRRKRKLRA